MPPPPRDEPPPPPPPVETPVGDPPYTEPEIPVYSGGGGGGGGGQFDTQSLDRGYGREQIFERDMNQRENLQ